MQYAVSLYWALTTMATIGYGDIYPITELEKVFTMFCMIVACGTFAFMVGSVTSIINGGNTIIRDFK
jgi:hyperpolarization activated cyclic nucleotide-gated potassium channel 2